MAIGRAAQRDDIRLHPRQAVVIQSQALHRARTKVVRDNVAVRHQLEEYLLTLGMGDIQTEAFFVAGPVGKRATFIPPLLTGRIIRERPGEAVVHMRGAFHPDDLSTEISQKCRAPGKHMHLLQGEHPDALQDGVISHRHLLSARGLWIREPTRETSGERRALLPPGIWHHDLRTAYAMALCLCKPLIMERHC